MLQNGKHEAKISSLVGSALTAAHDARLTLFWGALAGCSITMSCPGPCKELPALCPVLGFWSSWSPGMLSRYQEPGPAFGSPGTVKTEKC